MHSDRFIQYVNLPVVPEDILKNISVDPADYVFSSGPYWTDQHNQELNEWAQTHIGKNMYFAFQCFTGPVELHRDIDTQIKLNYIIVPGGDAVTTEFYADDGVTMLNQHIIPSHSWHILRANVLHRVCNISAGQVRFAITARIF